MWASVFAGTLPSSWSNPEAFPSLITLTLFNMALTGSLPASWAGKGLFPSLGSMALGADPAGRLGCITGPMPAEWATPFSFQLLEILALRTCFASEHAWHQQYHYKTWGCLHVCFLISSIHACNQLHTHYTFVQSAKG